MSREVDRRRFAPTPAMESRATELRAIASEISARLPGAHRVRIERFDPVTANPVLVVSESAPAEKGNYVQRALDHIQQINPALGLTTTQPAEFVADPNPQKASSGAVTVHLQQQYKGIPIFQAAEAVRFTPDGSLKETLGTSFTLSREIDVSPALTVEEATVAAAQHVAVPDEEEQGHTDPFGQPLEVKRVDLGGFEPKVVTAFPDKADHPSILEPGPFGQEIKAGLIWFPMDRDLRLSWEILLTMPNFEGQFRILVNAENRDILYCRQLMQTVLGRGNVYRVDGGNPREVTDFPRNLMDYGLPTTNLPPAFPDHWVDSNRTVGNNVEAHLGNTGRSFHGSRQNGVLTFDPTDAVGDEQKVLNIFYYNCYMHDFFYLLGFTEASGNFQRNNLGRGGVARDRVDARSHPGTVFGTANMLTKPDGMNPIMNMGLVASTNRHTAFDSTVVFHEFMHGVTNRLVGGPMNTRALEDLQCRGMGEGWGDYIACTINNTNVVGAWVVDRAKGIRGFPYDSNFPDGFGDLGTGRYVEVHNIGEIWCASLLEMNRVIGKVLGGQLVVDALMLSRANPSFLDMRDSILSALDNKLAGGQLSTDEHTTARRQIWEVFARFGMGINAKSDGAGLTGIVADTSVPQEVTGPQVSMESTPSLEIPDRDPSGISDSLNVSQTGTVRRLSVFVDIRHTFIGDLRVNLVSPERTSVFLHRGAGGAADNLVRSYSTENTAALANLKGKEVAGDWQLHVADVFSRDIGTLRRWSLEIELEGGPPQ